MSTVERWGQLDSVPPAKHLRPRSSHGSDPHNDFEEWFAGVHHEGVAAIIVTLRPISFLEQNLDRCVLFPLLRNATSLPHSDEDLVLLP